MTQHEQPHVAVVGTGPCGAIAASRLAAHGVRVTLLESGRRRPRGVVVRAAGNTVFRYTSQQAMSEGGHLAAGDPGTKWYWSLSHGGLSNYWTGAVPRFAPEDFTEGARLDERFRWPISYADLVPYYELVERAVGVTAGSDDARNLPANVTRHRAPMPSDWAEGARRLDAHGRSLVPLPLAKGTPWMAAFRSTEFNSYTGLVRPLERYPTVEMRSGAHVRHLVWSTALGRVNSVSYLDVETGAEQQLAVDGVVVAAGALNSTRILASSRSDDFPHGLGNSSGVLGRYLHDHPKEWWPFVSQHEVTLPHHPLYLTREDYQATEPLLAASSTIGLASQRDRLRTFVRGRGARLGVQFFGTMAPSDHLAVKLADSARDVFGEPLLEIDVRYDGPTTRNMERARDRLVEAFEQMGNPIETPDEFAPLLPGSSVHYGGTVRMHASREFGMLDKWNRLHDVPNVVVCDSSCFTTGPEKNPTLTAMAIAARAADRLATDLA